MSLRPALLLLGSLLSATLFAAESPRFSQSISAEQRVAAGLDALTSDEIAAIDALVRLNHRQVGAVEKRRTEERSPIAAMPEEAAQSAAFVASLSADQKHAAGIDRLSPEQQTNLDGIVAALFAPAEDTVASTAKTVEAVEFFPDRWEVHGEFGLSFGFGNHGYRSRAAWLQTSLLDTKTGTEFSVGVATGKEEGDYLRHFRYGRARDYDWEHVSFGLTFGGL